MEKSQTPVQHTSLGGDLHFHGQGPADIGYPAWELFHEAWPGFGELGEDPALHFPEGTCTHMQLGKRPCGTPQRCAWVCGSVGVCERETEREPTFFFRLDVQYEKEGEEERCHDWSQWKFSQLALGA